MLLLHMIVHTEGGQFGLARPQRAGRAAKRRPYHAHAHLRAFSARPAFGQLSMISRTTLNTYIFPVGLLRVVELMSQYGPIDVLSLDEGQVGAAPQIVVVVVLVVVLDPVSRDGAATASTSTNVFVRRPAFLGGRRHRPRSAFLGGHFPICSDERLYVFSVSV